MTINLKAPIAEEHHVIKRLEGEGWAVTQGGSFVLRILAGMAEELRKRDAASCTYQWATTDSYSDRTEADAKRLVEACQMVGLHCYLQRDPRGATLYVSALGPVSDRSYNTDAVNVRPVEKD